MNKKKIIKKYKKRVKEKDSHFIQKDKKMCANIKDTNKKKTFIK